jgi:hypothetical protein
MFLTALLFSILFLISFVMVVSGIIYLIEALFLNKK